MNADKISEDAWFDELLQSAQCDFGQIGWTRAFVMTNFRHHYEQGRTPYSTLILEGYPPIP